MPKRKKTDLNKLPVYEIVIDPNDITTGVKMISLLSDPAIEVKGMYFSPDEEIITPPCHYAAGTDTPNCRCEIINGEWVVDESSVCEYCLENKQRWDDRNLRFKKQKFTANKEQQIVVGPFLIPDIKIYRRDDDGTEYFVVFTKEVIQLIVQKFNKSNNNKSINVDHTNTMAPAYIMENWVIADSMYDKSKMFGYDLPVGTWFGSVKIEDEKFWNEQVKELDKYSFSVQGLMGEKLMQFAIKADNSIDYLLSKLTINELISLAKHAIKILPK